MNLFIPNVGKWEWNAKKGHVILPYKYTNLYVTTSRES